MDLFGGTTHRTTRQFRLALRPEPVLGLKVHGRQKAPMFTSRCTGRFRLTYRISDRTGARISNQVMVEVQCC